MWQLDTLKGSGVRPRTVVDVGTGRGTPQLYEAFPKSYQVLVEPLKEHEPGLQNILTRYDGEYFLTAVGSSNRKATITVEPKRIHKSSLHQRTAMTSTGDLAEKRKITVTTLDTLMEERSFRPPFGLKIDTEGFELEVIRGAPKFLRKTQFVIAEVSVAERFVGGYSFAEFTGAMTRNGFFLWDIVNVGGGRIVDAVFLPSFNYQPTSLLLRSARSRAKNIMRAVGQRWT
jgi:FkbM family methyltransferase